MENRNTIVVVAALSQEFAGLRKHLRDESVSEEDGIRSFCGQLEGRSVALVVSGVGVQNAARATRLALKRHSPKCVISIGYAGGLTPAAKPGAIILPALACEKGDARLKTCVPLFPQEISPDAGLLKLAQSAAQEIRQSPVGGTILTVPAVIATRAAKKALHAQTGAVAVDMESTGIGAACREAGVRCVFVRCVTDGVEDEIPVTKEISAAFRGRIKVLPFLWGLVKRPSVALAVWRLFRRAHRASWALGQVVRGICHGLA